jgi:hypothetical protein
VILTALDPGPHDLGGQPMPADIGLLDGGHAVAQAHRVCTPGQEERGDICV